MQLVPVMDTRNNENIAFFFIDYSQKSNFRGIISDMCCNSCRKKQISSHLLDIISLFVSKFTAQHSTAQHSTAQHSTGNNYARIIFSGYPCFKSNLQKSLTADTFSHRKTAHDAGKITSCSWVFHILNLPFYVERGFGIIVFHLIFIIWQKEMRHEKNDKMDYDFSCCNDGMVRISVL